MKSFRSTLIFAALVAGVVGLSIWQSQRSEKAEAAKAQEGRVFDSANAELVTKLEIQNGTDKFVVEKANGEWTLSAPVKDLADSSAVATLVRSIVDEKAKKVELGKSVNWAQYGLEPPVAKITLGDKDKHWVLNVSEKETFDHKRYLRLDGSDSLLVGEAGWKGFVEKKANQVRNKKLFPAGKVVQTMKVEISGRPALNLEKLAEGWKIQEAGDMDLDMGRITRFVSAVTDLSANDFVMDAPKPNDLSKYGLQVPWAKITVGFGGDKDKIPVPEWTLLVGQSKEKAFQADLFLKTSLNDTIYKIYKTKINDLDVTLNEFRNKKKPFAFDKDKAHELTLNTEKAKIKLVKKEGQWKLAQPQAGKVVAEDQVTKLVDTLHELDATDFLGAKNSPQPLKNSVVLKGEDGKTVFELQWGGRYSFKRGQAALTLAYAKTSDAKDLLGVEEARLNGIPTQSLLKDEAPPAPAAATPETKKTEVH